MKEESIVHIKVDYEEALQSKKDLLSSEVNFLKILKIIKKYELLRREELNNKIRMQNKIRDLKANLTKINQIFPKIKLPDILKKKMIIEKEVPKVVEKPVEVPIKVKEETEEDDLEVQLREIQDKLKRLG
jgi:hypothetical protein